MIPQASLKSGSPPPAAPSPHRPRSRQLPRALPNPRHQRTRGARGAGRSCGPAGAPSANAHDAENARKSRLAAENTRKRSGAANKQKENSAAKSGNAKPSGKNDVK